LGQSVIDVKIRPGPQVLPMTKLYQSIQAAVHPTLLLRSVFAVSLIIMSACAVTKSPAPLAVKSRAPGQEAVEARALQYWDHRRNKDLDAAYGFYCSDYRARVSRGEFLKLTRLVRFDLQDVRVIRVEGEPPRANVTVGFRFTLPLPLGQLADGEATDAWKVDADGRWCKEDEPLVMPFPGATPPAVPAPPG
jgi:hypothetical protein